MTSVINQTWLQPVRMSSIIFHWSAGAHKASALDKKDYRIIMEGSGTVVKGDLRQREYRRGGLIHSDVRAP